MLSHQKEIATLREQALKTCENFEDELKAAVKDKENEMRKEFETKAEDAFNRGIMMLA